MTAINLLLTCCPAGVIEQNFSPGPFAMQLSSKVYGLTWRFREEGLRADLENR
jgi:hypothetical protein